MSSYSFNEERTRSYSSIVIMIFLGEYPFSSPTTPRSHNVSNKERKLQRALLEVRKKYGTNALLRGFNYMEGGTARERNHQIGGHKS